MAGSSTRCWPTIRSSVARCSTRRTSTSSGAPTVNLARHPHPEENACAADAITALVAELTRDAQAALHVSIAGGRKTMGFYLGYAFSLFARPQDELSHVLVSAPFESHPEFFFRSATPRRLATRDGQHLDTADARITLARIPVVRLRHGQPQALLDGRASFGGTVAAIQRSLQPPRLHIDLPRKMVLCGETAVQLPPQQFAWLSGGRTTPCARGPANLAQRGLASLPGAVQASGGRRCRCLRKRPATPARRRHRAENLLRAKTTPA
ncbi:MAG: CRISPR-associated ring nuclease Csm6 [Burkholderiaceae bacterium]